MDDEDPDEDDIFNFRKIITLADKYIATARSFVTTTDVNTVYASCLI